MLDDSPLGRRPVTADNPRRSTARPAGVREARWTGRLVQAATYVAVVGAAGCSSSTTSPAPTSSNANGRGTEATSTVAGAPSPSGTRGSENVEKAYRDFLVVNVSFTRLPESRWRSELGRVATDPQLSFAIAVSRQQRRNGIALYGRINPRAPQVTMQNSRQATLRDCADFSTTGQADARTGRPKTVGIARTPLLVKLAKGTDGRWRVAAVDFPSGTC